MVSPMARGRRRGPFLLRFRALLVSLNLHAAKVVDTRQAGKVRYSLQDCYVCAFALFYLICCGARYVAFEPFLLVE